MFHHLDPPIQWAAAESCGKLVAQGVLAIEDVLPPLYAAAVSTGYPGSKRGLRARLFWHVRDHAEHWRRERDRTEYAIRQIVAPLVEERDTAEAILACAYVVNEDRREPLLRSEVRVIVAEILRGALARMAGRRRHV